MNIFYVHPNAEIAAQSMVDRHVVKMILETAQILSTAHRVLDGEQVVVTGWIDEYGIKHRKKTLWRLSGNVDAIMYTATHINHPSAVWARETDGNYNWLYDHLVALGREYSHRYGRIHATIDKLGVLLKDSPKNIPQGVMTTMPSCMDKQYIIGDDPVENYRNYYNKGKASLHRWTDRFPPEWIDQEIQLIPGPKHIYIARNT